MILGRCAAPEDRLDTPGMTGARSPGRMGPGGGSGREAPMGKPRWFFVSLAAAAAALLLLPGTALATDTSPVPIPGGLDFNGQLIHVFAPGPVELGFQGLDIEPSTITDFTGDSA